MPILAHSMTTLDSSDMKSTLFSPQQHSLQDRWQLFLNCYANSVIAGPSSSSTTTTTPRRTITTGAVTTSTQVKETVTTTNDSGNVVTETYTSWVEIRPTSTESADPSLQNAASSTRGSGVVAAVAVAGVVAGMLMI